VGQGTSDAELIYKGDENGPFLDSITSDGNKLILNQMDPDTSWYIVSLTTDGIGDLIEIVKTDSFDGNPTISPDGKWLAFVSDRSGDMQIYVKGLEDKSPLMIPVSSGFGSEPFWHPTENQIFYTNGSEFREITFEINGNKFERKSDKKLFVVANEIYMEYSLIHPDGDRFLTTRKIVEGDESGQEPKRNRLKIITGLRALLEQKLSNP